MFYGYRALDERRKFEKETAEATELLEKLRSDNEDIIQYLQRTLQSRDDQCSELKERLKGMQLVIDYHLIYQLDGELKIGFILQTREKENEDFIRQIETSKRSFDYIEQKMQSEIKLLRKFFKKEFDRFQSVLMTLSLLQRVN